MRKFVATLAVITLGVGLGVAVAAPAYASASDCPSGYVCIWDNSNFTGLIVTKFQSPGTCYTLTSSQTNRGNAFYNRLTNGKHVQMYRDNSCTGSLLREWNGSTGPFAAGFLSVFYNTIFANDQDKVSSIFFNTG